MATASNSTPCPKCGNELLPGEKCPYHASRICAGVYEKPCGKPLTPAFVAVPKDQDGKVSHGLCGDCEKSYRSDPAFGKEAPRG